jgi:mono/diheme cytochrome c family protein
MKIGRMMGVLLAGHLLLACTADGGDPSGLPVGDPDRGAIAVEAGSCRSCHAPDLAGSPDPIQGTVYSSNITPDDETGIGMWTDQELDDVLRLGKELAGTAVCDPMPVYDNMSDQQVADIIAYLRAQPPVRREVMDSVCH